MDSIDRIQKKIIRCERCPRLRNYCTLVAKEKRRQFIDETYWGKPVPSFGDHAARLMIVGLAPAAHGGNRTGRMFTGDNSGLWLYRALYRAGFANQPTSENRQDGLELKDAYITASIHCAPPGNKPLPEEIENCSSYLIDELKQMSQVKVYLVLGQIGLKTLWKFLPEACKPRKALPRFHHGMEVELLDGRVLLGSFHPSQQNTFTRKLTEPMFDSIFTRAKSLIS